MSTDYGLETTMRDTSNYRGEPAMPTTHRPIRVTILALLAFISGILGLLASLSILSGSAIMSARGTELPGQVPTFGLILLVISAVQVVFGYAVRTMKPWAWAFGMVLQVTSLVLALVYLAIGAEFYSQIGGLVLGTVSMVLLLTPDVRRALGKVE